MRFEWLVAEFKVVFVATLATKCLEKRVTLRGRRQDCARQFAVDARTDEPFAFVKLAETSLKKVSFVEIRYYKF